MELIGQTAALAVITATACLVVRQKTGELALVLSLAGITMILLTGLPVHYYVVVNPDGFRRIIDTLDGVWIDVPIRMYYSDPDQGLYIDLKPGYQLLDGKKAEQFCRFRSGYANADLGRIEAQQNFVKALFEQKLKPEYLMKSGEIYQHIEDCVDTNFSVSDIPIFLKML